MEFDKLCETQDFKKVNSLASISHEMRSPLSAILGYVDVLSLEDTSVQERQESLQAIRRNGEVLLCLIDDILDLARFQSTEFILQKQRCSLNKILEETYQDLLSKVDTKRVQLKMNYLAQDVFIDVDILRLRQILINIVGNAVKFTRQGFVQVRVLLEPLAESSRVKINFRVVDTGIGIDPEACEKIFIPFVQGDAITSKKYGGAGLGLSIARNLAQAMGGDVKLISTRVGSGSIFQISVLADVREL